jgi:hypothetical protein
MVQGQFVRHGVGRACSADVEPTRRLEAMGCQECRLMCEAAHEASSLDHWHSCAAFQCAESGSRHCALWDELLEDELLDRLLLGPTRPSPGLQCWRRLRELDNTSLQIPSDWPLRYVHGWAVSNRTGMPRCDSQTRRAVRLVTWHELPAACTRVRRFQFPNMGLEFDRREEQLPRLSSVPQADCTVIEWSFPGNTRPPVNVLDFYGEQLTVQPPGWVSAYAWDVSFDASVGLNQRAVAEEKNSTSALGYLGVSSRFGHAAFRGHDVAESVRVVHVVGGVVSTNGNLCAGELCFSDYASFMEGPDDLVVTPWEHSTRCGKVVTVPGHLMVIRQKYADQFGHMAIQTLPQAVLLLEAARKELPPNTKLSLLLHSSTHGNVLRILEEVLGSSIAMITSNHGISHFAANSASIPLAPPGTMPHEVIYGRGCMRSVFTVLHRFPGRVLDRVVYMRRNPRGGWGRRLVNFDSVMRRINSSLIKPQYELTVVNPGDHPLLEMRQLFGRTRVLLGGHGAAWANLLFAPVHQHDFHAVELNWLRGTSMYARLPYYAFAETGGKFWMLEREKTTTDHPILKSAGGLAGSSYNRDFRVSEDDVHTVLWHAGVCHCRRTSKSTPIYYDDASHKSISFFLTKVQGSKTVELKHEPALGEALPANMTMGRHAHPVVKVALDDVDTAPKGWLRCLAPS